MDKIEELKNLKSLLDGGAITEAEFATLRNNVINSTNHQQTHLTGTSQQNYASNSYASGERQRDLPPPMTYLVQKQSEIVPSVGDWLTIFFVSIIPLVGLILLIIWANDDKNINRKNYSIATLTWWGILVVFSFLILVPLAKNLFR